MEFLLLKEWGWAPKSELPAPHTRWGKRAFLAESFLSIPFHFSKLSSTAVTSASWHVTSLISVCSTLKLLFSDVKRGHTFIPFVSSLQIVVWRGLQWVLAVLLVTTGFSISPSDRLYLPVTPLCVLQVPASCEHGRTHAFLAVILHSCHSLSWTYTCKPFKPLTLTSNLPMEIKRISKHFSSLGLVPDMNATMLLGLGWMILWFKNLRKYIKISFKNCLPHYFN